MATKIDIISGFLGAGKTTLIKKLLKEAYADEQVVLIENEFGEIGIDGGFLKEAGIQIREMNSGCICCSLVGDFGTSLKEVVDKYHPDRILIEPSGVGKLSDVIKAVQGVQGDVDIVLNSYTTVVDAKKCKMYMRNFGEFFDNQVEYAGAIIMSRTDIIDEKKAQQAMELLRGINAKAAIITTPIEKLDGRKILEVMEKPVSLEEELMSEEEVCPECGHVHEQSRSPRWITFPYLSARICTSTCLGFSTNRSRYIVLSEKECIDSCCAVSNNLPNSFSSLATRIPFPPPPADALIMTGKPISFTASCACATV